MHIPDQLIPSVIQALEHHAAYMRATKRDDAPYRELVEKLTRATTAVPKRRPLPARSVRRSKVRALRSSRGRNRRT